MPKSKKVKQTAIDNSIISILVYRFDQILELIAHTSVETEHGLEVQDPCFAEYIVDDDEYIFRSIFQSAREELNEVPILSKVQALIPWAQIYLKFKAESCSVKDAYSQYLEDKYIA